MKHVATLNATFLRCVMLKQSTHVFFGLSTIAVFFFYCLVVRVSFHCRELSSSGVDVVGVDAVVCDVIATPAQVSAAAVLEVAGVLPEAAMDGLWAAIASNSFDRLEETLEDIFLEVQHALWP